MQTSRELIRFICTFAFVSVAVACSALPQGWQHTQQFNVPAPGLVKLSLPLETLDAARPALEDVRLFDEAGHELPFLIEHLTPLPKVVRNAKTFSVSLQSATTLITVETGLSQPVDGVTLETPAMNFIKAVRVEGSSDGRNWRSLAQGQPIFRESYGAGQLQIVFPVGLWPWLRLTVDDRRSEAIPFTGALIHAAVAEETPSQPDRVTIVERNENPGETRITLNLGAANLDLASISIDTDEGLFTRMVKLAVPEIAEDSIRAKIVGQGTIYRVAVEGEPKFENLTVPLETRVPSRELVLLIQNQDSPPLPVRGVRIERRPIHLVFMTRQAGVVHLLTGNKLCAAPRYDVAALAANLKNVPLSSWPISSLSNNPDFRPSEALPGLDLAGAAMDVSAWKFRKGVQFGQGGAQQIDLDLDVLAHTSASFADLRILRVSNQVPYILQRTSLSRPLTLSMEAANDARNPKLSRWRITLPRAGLPLTRLICAAKTPLFKREVSLFEELTDERGDKYRHALGSASWTQTADRKTKEFSLEMNESPRSDTLFLETDNGDNPPIELEKFTAFYPVTRVLLKAKADDRLFLYYGNPSAGPPTYDLSLVAAELLAADKSAGILGGEEQLKKTWGSENRAPGTGSVAFWGALALVIVGLLAIISRLLPKPPPSA